MSLTAKIRIYLILVAVLPSLLVMSIIYFGSLEQAEESDRQFATDALARYARYEGVFLDELHRRISDVATSSVIQRTMLLIQTGRTNRADIASLRPGLDFLEIIDRDNRVLVSAHRPGLVGEPILASPAMSDTILTLHTVEYDIDGRHAAIGQILVLDSNLSLYAGRYLDTNYRSVVSELIDGRIDVTFNDDQTYDGMQPNQLYSQGDTLLAILIGGESSGYRMTARFVESQARPVIVSLLRVTALVALVAIMVAIGLGMLITNRAKREIDNLISATDRVARGDFSTPVMAYNEGEFSQLADSFSDMMTRLKNLQQSLATTEKIAAWQAMGRKIAHEIKNPLTPISIAVDDLRQSYNDELPGFDRILRETTGTIKSETERLSKLLDQFVKFARMNPPVLQSVTPREILDSVAALYKREIQTGRLIIDNTCHIENVIVDPGQIQQLLINLVKNSLEAGDDIAVTLSMANDTTTLTITVVDTGTGFHEDVLEAAFQPYLSKKKNGSGLGLVICQRIVHDHGGTITLYNQPEGGAGVAVTLPIANGKSTDSR